MQFLLPLALIDLELPDALFLPRIERRHLAAALLLLHPQLQLILLLLALLLIALQFAQRGIVSGSG
jgi:hypothetical protein